MMNMVSDFSKGEENELKMSNFLAAGNFNLSQNKSLRTFETTAHSIRNARDKASGFLKTVLSSITSPAPLDVVIVYCAFDLGHISHDLFCTEPGPPHFRHCSMRIAASICPEDRQQQFKVLREMQSVRDFRLVLCADVFDCIVEPAIRELEYAVKKERGPDYLLRKPLVISERRTPRTRCSDWSAGWSLPVYASAL